MANGLIGLPYKYAILGFGLLVVIYSVHGGMRAVSYTDVLQGIAILVVISWLMQTILHKIGGGQSILGTLTKNHPEKLAFFSHPKFVFKLKKILFVHTWSSHLNQKVGIIL